VNRLINLPAKLRKNLRLEHFYFYSAITFLIVKMALILSRDSQRSFATFDTTGYLKLSELFPSSYASTIDPYLLELSLLRTPGYPIFLWIFHGNPIYIAIAQSVIQILIAYMAVLIYRKIQINSSRTYERATFILVNLETSLTVHSFFLLSEVLFSLFVICFVYFFLKYLQNESKIISKAFVFASIAVIAIITIRPIGIIFLAYFPLAALFSKKWLKVGLLLLVMLSWIGFWSSYNHSRAGIFVYSTIQNHNLLMYEGAGAKAIDTSRPLYEVQRQELGLRNETLRNTSDINSIDSYSQSRGIELIANHAKGFLEMHIIGILKILFGPNQGEAIRFLSNGERTKAETNAEKILLLGMVILTFLIGLFGLLSASTTLFSNSALGEISRLILLFLVASGGAQAYGRFRAPLAAFLVISSIIFLAKILENRSKFNSNPNRFRRKFKDAFGVFK